MERSDYDGEFRFGELLESQWFIVVASPKSLCNGRGTMGWMRTILLGDIGNRLDISDTEQEIASLKEVQKCTTKSISDREDQIDQLLREVGTQKLAIQALTRFIVSKGIILQDELDDFIKEVDAEDGVIDGQMTIDPSSRRLHFPKKSVEDGTFRKMPPQK
ncbi:hypothetical protein HNR46_000809 [Haloferula luteola]|uniref:Uncharacterized protein n=1 Tax=Haloferula luteola TaxID=595692 RepID=A0A840VCK1_9BACT|nr:hypothetical protein [Haloferula luteola]MBB5350581.1 hypothetical protein [Haloferula luteola]